MRKNRSKYNDAFVTSIRIEKGIQDIAKSLGLSDTQAYHHGVMTYAKEHPDMLKPENFDRILQYNREKIQKIQEESAFIERVCFDCKVRQDISKRKKTEIRTDDRGKEYVVVISE